MSSCLLSQSDGSMSPVSSADQYPVSDGSMSPVSSASQYPVSGGSSSPNDVRPRSITVAQRCSEKSSPSATHGTAMLSRAGVASTHGIDCRTMLSEQTIVSAASLDLRCSELSSMQATSM